MEPFNPKSTQQLQDWLRFHKIPIPLDRKTRKPTTNKKALEFLARDHPFIADVLDCRKLKKAESYLTTQGVGLDGRFHPTYPFSADTGRLGAINPNLQNQPHYGVDKELVEEIRSTIVPSPGMVLVELDWRAIEAVLTGWFAGDEDWIWLSQLDSHSYLTGHALAKLWKKLESFPLIADVGREAIVPLVQMIKREFPEERELLKRFSHATSYGMGARHASEILRVPIHIVKELFRIKAEAAPRIAEWQLRTQIRAHSEGFLETPFGYRRAFWNVFTVPTDRAAATRDNSAGVDGGGAGGPRRSVALSEEANKVLAFLPQGTGAGMLRAALVEVDELPGCWEWFHLLVPIHDAILLEAPEERSREAASLVKGVMEKSWPELGGLSVGVDVKIGKDWSQMKAVQL